MFFCFGLGCIAKVEKIKNREKFSLVFPSDDYRCSNRSIAPNPTCARPKPSTPTAASLYLLPSIEAAETVTTVPKSVGSNFSAM